MAPKKEAVALECGTCSTKFRLWIPEELLPAWGEGLDINCIKCGAGYVVTQGHAGLEAAPAEVSAPAKTDETKDGPAPDAGDTDAADTGTPETDTTDTEEAPAAAEDDGQDVVLFIEDDKLAAAIAENTLSEMGLTVRSATNSTEAINAFDKGGVNLIVTDLHLKNPDDPDASMDGEELLKTFTDKGSSIPTIVTTGKDIIDEIAMDPKWLDLHVRGFIQKANPFWAEELKDKVKEILTKT